MLVKGRKMRKTWITLAICVSMYILLVLSGLLNKQKIWPAVPVDYLDNKQEFSLEDGDQYGTITNGPYTEIPAGVYRLKWQIEGDGVNVIRLMTSNEIEICPSEFKTTPGTFEGEAYFELKDTAHNFRIATEFCNGTWIAVHNFRLYSPMYRDNYITLAAMILAAVILMWLHESGNLRKTQAEILIVFTIAVFFVSAPAVREDTIFATDVGFHAARLRNLLDGLRNGQFPVRVGGYSYNGYGAVTSVFYPDILLYPFALLLHLGASITYAINALIIMVNALSALCMYVAVKRIFSDYKAGVFAAIVYVCSGFRVYHLYAGFMVGQTMAMAFLPLFMLGLWEVFWGDKTNWPVLAIGATLVFQSHMVTTIMCAGVATTALIGFGLKLWREGRVKALLLAILTTILLNLTTIVPLITTYLSGVTTSVMSFGFVEMARKAVHLLGTDMEIGLAIVLGVVALVCADKEIVNSVRMHIACIMAPLGLICVWLSTDMFPWERVLVYTRGMLEILQFPWRFLVIGIFALSLVAGLGYACLLHDQGSKGILAVLTVAVLCVAPIIENALNKETMEFGMDSTPYMLTPEYQFEGTDLVDTRSRQVIVEGDVQMTEYEKNGTRIRAYVDSRKGGMLTFPLFGFDGYAASVNDIPVNCDRGYNNRLTVILPENTQGVLDIHYAGHLIWRIADIISLLTLIVFGYYCVRIRRIHWLIRRDTSESK